jgi:hypothetical protein
MQNTELSPADRNVLNAVYKIGAALGRKFEASDMTIQLRQAAAHYAAIYQLREDDDFMRDMKLRAANGAFLTDGQSKGVLNVLMADARRRLAAKRPAAPTAPSAPAATPFGPNVASIPDGRYRVTLPDGDHLALRFDSKNEWAVEKFGEGTRKISLRVGGSDSEREWNGVGTAASNGAVSLWKSAGPRVAAAVKVLAEAARDEQGWLVAGLAFAQEGSRCFRCGKELDQPESLLVGYGETCADKLGLPWGAKAIPMSVRLAQAAQAASEMVAIDPETGVEESADELLALVKQPAPVQTTPVATSIKQEELPLDPSELATDGRPLSRYQRDQRNGTPRPAGGYSYEDVFGDD